MINDVCVKLQFEYDLLEYWYERMYPPGYRRESPMVTLSQKHIDAIAHAELFFDPLFSKLESPRLRKHLEDDLLSLAELKLYIHERMSQGPKFPEMEDKKPDDPGNSKSRA